MNREDQTKLSRQKILQAAIVEFGGYDYENASTNRLCERSGISKGLIYHYYKNKAKLFASCAKLCFEELEHHLEGYFCPEKDPGRSFCAYYGTCVGFFQQHPAYLRIYRCAVFTLEPDLCRTLRPVLAHWRAYNAQALRPVVECIALRPSMTLDAALPLLAGTVDTLLGIFAGHVFTGQNGLTDSAKKIAEETASRYVSILLYGVSSRVNENAEDDA